MKPVLSFRTVFVSLVIGVLVLLSVLPGCGKDEEKPEVGPTIHIAENGSLNIISPDGGIAIHHLIPGYLSKDGWVNANDYPVCTTDKDRSKKVNCSGLEGLPDLMIAIENSRGGVSITIHLSGEVNFIVEGFRLMTSDLTFEDGDDRYFFLHNGYQSWAYSGIDMLSSDDASSLEGGVIDLSFYNEDLLNEEQGVSWWNTALVPAGKAGPALIAGTLAARRWKSAYMARPLGEGRIRFIAIQGTNGDSVHLSPDRPVRSESTFFLFAGDPIKGLIRYADAVACNVNPPVWSGRPPMGWFSWNELFETVDEEAVIAHADIMAERALDRGFDLLEIDDGWERSWGDWEANEKFPSGMEGVADKIVERGLRPGLWVAPFMVSPDSEIFRSHPDWVLKGKDGSPVVYHGFGMERYNLDLTHPGALSWLRETFVRLKDYGYLFFKLDFLFGGAYEGERYDPAMTSLEAFHMGMAAVRDAVGENVYINACGAPFLPSVGWVNSMRTGSDIALAQMDLAWAFFSAQARNTASRIFAHKRLFAVDPDQAPVREPLSLEEARAAATQAALAGETYSFGDDLTRLPEERWEILLNPHLVNIALSPSPAVPLDLFDNGNPDIGRVLFPVIDVVMDPVGTVSVQPGFWTAEGLDGDVYLAVFNWEKYNRGVDIDVQSIGLEADADLKEVWTENAIGISGHDLKLTLPPHSVRLIYPFTR